MVGTNKTKTSLAKFEEFFSIVYKNEVYNVLDNYPSERTIIIDYFDLQKYDEDLADLLIEKPEEVIAASKKAIKNIDPLMKDAELNLRFKNLSNIIPFKEVSSRYIGKFIKIKGVISSLKKSSPRVENAVFECRGCMRLHEVEQTSSNFILEPSICSECGGGSLDYFKKNLGI